jgi:exopolysaccharide biosynthesis polyprenyl glycosylphosphotransferase
VWLPTDLRALRASPSWALRRTLLLTDGVLLAVVWGVALAPQLTLDSLRGEVTLVAAVAVGLLACRALSLYRYRVCVLRSSVRWRLGAVALATGSVVAASGLLPGPSTAIATLSAFVALSIGRAHFDRTLRHQRSSGHHIRDLLAVGHPREVDRVVELLEAHPEAGFRVVGYVGPVGPCRVERLGPSKDVVTVVGKVRATGALLVANGMASDHLNRVARALGEAGVPIHVSSGLAGISHQRVRSHPLAHEPFLALEPRRTSRSALRVKRGVDVVLSAVLLVVAAPILAVAAIAIRLDSPGPVIFRQTRVGRDGDLIVLHKLRTMTVGAEAMLADLHERNERAGPLFKVSDDPRVTRVGRWLRSTSIDELPQLVDALAGRLSLVGPRPALPDEVAAFDDALAAARSRMRPGITGLWQVEARHNPSFVAYRHLDLFYADNWSLRLDAVLLAATVQVVVADALRLLRRRSTPRRVVPGPRKGQPGLPAECDAATPVMVDP